MIETFHTFVNLVEDKVWDVSKVSLLCIMPNISFPTIATWNNHLHLNLNYEGSWGIFFFLWETHSHYCGSHTLSICTDRLKICLCNLKVSVIILIELNFWVQLDHKIWLKFKEQLFYPFCIIHKAFSRILYLINILQPPIKFYLFIYWKKELVR